jgi:hypothetical protein
MARNAQVCGGGGQSGVEVEVEVEVEIEVEVEEEVEVEAGGADCTRVTRHLPLINVTGIQ